jgi:uncharacterized protein YdbL (DUF1318 family)
MKKLFTAILMTMVLQSAWAIDIGSAKDQGLVGEANSGYLAAVKTPASADVNALIADVNAKRRAEFDATAKKTGATIEQVAYRFYELAIQRTAPGNYYQDASGGWMKK